MESIKILVVNDHPLVRQGIIKILGLEKKFKVIAEAGTGSQGVSLALCERPDVVLLDLNLPDMTGIEVCREILKEFEDAKIIALTIYDDDAHVLESIKAGVTGYLPKDVDPDTLIEAIKISAAGGAYIHPSVAGKVLNDYGRISSRLEAKSREENPLTGREVEILALVAKGFTNRDIAERLYISEKTVKNHITNIFRKMEVRDRTEAVVHALKAKII